MLKAFSRVFHKTQGQEGDIEGRSPPTNEPTGGSDHHGGQRVLERKQAAGLGVQRAAGKGAGTPRAVNNLHHGNFVRPLAKDIAAAYSGKDLPRRTSFQQPKLHMKGPPPGSDGTYPLTADNIEWHMRLIPPMKESKYDRILRYVHMQQQNVAVMADLVQRDIDASMLMSGQIPYDLDLASPQRHSFEQNIVVPQGQQAQVVHSGHPHAASSSIGGVGMTGGVLHHPGVPPGGGHAYMSNNVMSPPPPIQHTVTNNTNTSATPQQNNQTHDVEEDDDTPLAAINSATSPPRQHQLDMVLANGGGGSGGSGGGMIGTLERYAQESANLPLPEPISPTDQARMSMVSFSSNMAANLHTSDMPVSRSQSQSLSDPRSASLHGSMARMTPVARSPTVQETGNSSQQFTTNPAGGQIRQPSFSSHINNRPSLDAITPHTVKPIHNDDDDDDDEPLLGKLSLGDVARVQAQAQKELEDEEDDNEPLQNQLRVSKLVEPRQLQQERPEVDQAVNDFAARMSTAFKSDTGDKGITQLEEARVIEQEQQQQQHIGNGDDDEDNKALEDSMPTLGLKVVNAVDNDNGSDDDSDGSANENEAANDAKESAGQHVVCDDNDDDNQPLAALSRHLSNGSMRPQQKQQILVQNLNLAVVSDSMSAANTQLQSNIAEDGDDDDQPLSSLMVPVQDVAAIDEPGFLPLPVPPSITDPDAVLVGTDERISPGRVSFGDRSLSPSLSSGVVRKPSSLSRSVNIADDISPRGVAVDGFDAPTNQSTPDVRNNGDRRSSLLSKQPSNLSGYSLPVGSAAMVMNKTSSLPKSLRVAPMAGGISATLPTMSHGRASFGITSQDMIAEDENEIDAAQAAPGAATVAANNTKPSNDDGSMGRGEVELSNDILDTAQLTGGGSIGRPWATGSIFNRSSTSLSGKRAMRGSTLGQNLTDELHKIREDLARSRKEDISSSRRSWQSTVALGMRKPWMRHESARSETALEKQMSLGQYSAAAVLEQASLNDATTPGLSDLPAGWEQTNPRPMTSYHNRASRWFGGHKKQQQQQPSQQQQQAADVPHAKDDSAVVLSGSPQSTAHSLTSRFNLKFGKLKKTFKHHPSGTD